MNKRRVQALARIFGLADDADQAAVLARLGRLADNIGDFGSLSRAARADAVRDVGRVLDVLDIDGVDNLRDLRRLSQSGNAADIAKFNRTMEMIRNGGRAADAIEDTANVGRRLDSLERWNRIRMALTVTPFALGAGAYAFAVIDKQNGGAGMRAALHEAKDAIVAGYHAVEDMDKQEWLANQIHNAMSAYELLSPDTLDLVAFNGFVDAAMSEPGSTKQDGMNAALTYRLKEAPIYMVKYNLRALVLDEIFENDNSVGPRDVNKMLAEGVLSDMMRDLNCASLDAHGIEITEQDILNRMTSDPAIVERIPPRLRDGLIQIHPELGEIFQQAPYIEPPLMDIITAGSDPITELPEGASEELRSYRQIGDAYFGKGYNTGATLANGNQIVMGDTQRIITGASTFYDSVRNAILRDNPDMDASAVAVGDPQTRFHASLLIAQHIQGNNGYIDTAGIEAAGIDLNIPETFAHLEGKIADIPNLEEQPWYQEYKSNLSDTSNDQEDVIEHILNGSILYGMGANGIQYWLTEEEYQQAYDALTDEQKIVALRPEVYEQVIHPEVVEPAYARNPELAEMHNNARASTTTTPTVTAGVTAPATLEDFAASASPDQLADMNAIANGSWRNASKERLDTMFNTASGLIGSGAIRGPENDDSSVDKVFDFIGMGFLTDFFSSNPIDRFNAFASLLPIIEFIGMIPGLDGFADMLKEKVQRIALDVIDEKVDAATDNPAIRGALERIGADADPSLRTTATNETEQPQIQTDETPEVESRFRVPTLIPGG